MQRITKSRCGYSLLAGFVWMLAIGQLALADEHDVDALLTGISGIGAPGSPGPLCVYGPNAFPLVEGATGNTRIPVVAAGHYEQGRVVALGHGSYFERATIDTADTGLLLTNAIEWVAGDKSSPRIGVAWVGAGVEELRAWLKEAGYDSVEVALTSDALASVDVLFVEMWNQSEREQDALGAFVRAGGGLVTATTGWGWAYLHPDKNLVTDFAGNRLLASVGIQWGDSLYIERTSESGYAVSGAPNTLTHAIEALDAMEARDAGSRVLTESEIGQALATLERTIQCLPPNDTLIAPRLRGVIEGAEWPSADNPVEVSDMTGRLAATFFVVEQRRLPAESVRAHPASADFPGSVPDDAERITRSLTIDTFGRRHSIGPFGDPFAPLRHSTGLYAAPGELVTVTVPAAAAESGALRVLVGAHTGGIWPRAEWTRMPEISRRFEVSSPTTRVANAFGGLIYVEVSNDADLGTVAVEIEGAVAAPRFVLGETSSAEWRNEIRDAPAPWAEIEGTNMIVTTESAKVRALDDPTDVAETWDRVLDLNAELAAWTEPRISPERFVVDRQLSHGWMLAGYPMLAHIEGNQSSYIVDTQHISTCRKEWTGSNWGFFHEIGHNHQSGDWTFEGTVEVTVNLFTLYVYDFLCGIVPTDHFPGSSKSWAEEMERYDFDDPDFGLWKQHPFLALIMYAQLQQEFGWEAYREVFAEYRNLEEADRPKSDEEKRDQWLVRFSRTVGRDLGPFFEAWGVPTSESARNDVAGLPKWFPAGFPPGGLGEDATYEINEALPGVPAKGSFLPAVLSEGSVTANDAGTTIILDNGGYIKLADGTRYTCASIDGCIVSDGAVTKGAVVRRANSTAEEGIPSFRDASGPGNWTYTVGTAIGTLTLPEADGGNGKLTYSLTPVVPGLTFDAATRQLAGTPARAGTYEMAFTAEDAGGDTDTLNFMIAVKERDEGAHAAVPFALLDGNDHPQGVLYSNGRFYVVDDSDDKVYAYAVAGQRDASADFDLDADNTHARGITFVNGRFYVVDGSGDRVFAYTGTGQRDASADFDLDADNTHARGITVAEGRLYVLDRDGKKVFAYTGTGQRDTAADFNLAEDSGAPEGIIFADGRFFVADSDSVSVYTKPMEPDNGDGPDTIFGAGEAINALPIGAWSPDKALGGRITIRSGRTTIQFDHGGYIEEGGYRYTCKTPAGCEFADREVELGTIVRTSAGTPADTQPSFEGASSVGNPSYRVGTAIEALALPEASGGNGKLSYTLTPDVPGLAFDAVNHRLIGTPSTAGTYEMNFTATDEDADTDTLKFTLAVEQADDGAYAEAFDLLHGNSEPEGITFADGRILVVDIFDDKVYAYAANGQRDASGDFDLDADNTWPTGITHAEGRFYVVDFRSEKVYAYTGSGQRDATADFELDTDNRSPSGITHFAGRFYVVDGGDEKVYAYDVTGQRDAGADFALDVQNTVPAGITHAADKFYVVDQLDELAYAYTATGQRDAAGDFKLDAANTLPTGIAYTAGLFLVVEPTDDTAYAYSDVGQRNPVSDVRFLDGNDNAAGIAHTDGRFLVVDRADNKVYAYTASGQRDAGADFDLDAENRNPEGITLAEDRFYVVDGDDAKVYAYTVTGQRDSAADFALNEKNGSASGIAYAAGRFHVVDLSDNRVYAYSLSGQPDAAGDFDLGADIASGGIAVAAGFIYVVDWIDEKVYAYTATGLRDTSADFNLEEKNSDPEGIAYAAGRFYVVDNAGARVYSYGDSEGQDDVQGQPTAVMTGSSVAESPSGSLETDSLGTGAERSIIVTDEGDSAQNARIVGGVWGTAGSLHQNNSRSDPYFFRIRGIAVGLTGADFDGDGLEDFVVKSAKGHTYLVSAVDLKEADGSDGTEDRTIDLDRASVPSNSLRLPAVHHDRVFRAGDIDFDGMDDLIVHDLLVSASVLRNATAGDRVLRLPLEHPRPDTGILRIAGSRLDRSAFALADFNADGVNDLLVGIPSRKGQMDSSVDTVYVASGAEWPYADAMDGALDGAISLDRMARRFGSWKIVSETRIAMGTSIGPVGDLNGDGFVDLMIGAPDMPFGANPNSGGLIVVSGAAMASLDAADGATDGEIKITQGSQEGTWKLGGSDFDIGTTASAAGDADGDGLNDLLLTANSGVYLVTGASIMATGSGGQMSATGTKRFAWMEAGLGVSDFDSDGFSDILLLGYGNAYLISGRDLHGLGDANGVVDFGIDTVPAQSWRLSFRDPSIELQGPASLADLNGDGHSELIVPTSVKGEVETYIISLTELRLLDLEDGQADGVVHLDQIGRSFAVN